jgi:hypothetical protein
MLFPAEGSLMLVDHVEAAQLNAMLCNHINNLPK